MKILVKVTEEIINDSALCPTRAFVLEGGKLPAHLERELIRNCMVSRAVKEIFPEAVTFETGIDPFGTNKYCLREDLIPIPRNVSNLIRIFDKMIAKQRREIQPFSFEIDVPMSVIEEIGINQAYKILSESKTLELVKI